MVVSLDSIYTYNLLLEKTIKLSKLYPKLIYVEHIGYSNDNRIIWIIKVGKGNTGPLFISGVHGRESINPTVILSIIENYSYNYYAYGEKLLDDFSLFFIPILNPDGYSIATEGFYSIKDTSLRDICKSFNIKNTEYKLNSLGIDINRNFASESFAFSNTSGIPNKEPETKALITICFEKKFLGMIDFHSRGNSIYYYRNAMDYEYNKNQFNIACSLSKSTKYSLYTKNLENTDNISGGNTVNFFSETFYLPALTIETVDNNATFPLYNGYCRSVFNEIKNVPMNFLKLLISSH